MVAIIIVIPVVVSQRCASLLRLFPLGQLLLPPPPSATTETNAQGYEKEQ